MYRRFPLRENYIYYIYKRGHLIIYLIKPLLIYDISYFTKSKLNFVTSNSIIEQY